MGVAWWWAPAAGARRHGAESRRVGCGLRAQLSEVEIGAGAVADGHGLSELPLGPEAVEDDGVDDDAQRLNNDLDNAADQRPVLETADEFVGHVVLEELSSFVVFASPAPHVLTIALSLALVQNAGTNGPHDNAEDEEGNGEDGVVSCNLLCPLVASS